MLFIRFKKNSTIFERDVQNKVKYNVLGRYRTIIRIFNFPLIIYMNNFV